MKLEPNPAQGKQSLSGERHDSHASECLRQPRQHREVSVKLNASESANAKRCQPVLMLQPAELALDSSTTPVQIAPALRVARDERMKPGSLDPPRLRNALADRAAPLGGAALGVGTCERPGSVLAGRREMIAAPHKRRPSKRDDRGGTDPWRKRRTPEPCRNPCRAPPSRAGRARGHAARDRRQGSTRALAPSRHATRPGGPCASKPPRSACTRRSRHPSGSRQRSGDPTRRPGQRTARACDRPCSRTAGRSRRRGDRTRPRQRPGRSRASGRGARHRCGRGRRP